MDQNSDHFVVNDLQYDDGEIRRIVADINRNGIAEIENAVPGWVLENAAQYLESERRTRGVEALSLRWSDMKACVLTELQKSRPLKKFMSRVLNEYGLPVPDDGYVHHVVRCTCGVANTRDAYKFHFDQYNLTVLLPIVTPMDEKLDCGDLIVFPNTRAFSSNLVKNLFFKLLFQNKITQTLASKPWAQRMFKANVVKVKPGNLYVFWGFRTYHGNKVIDPRLLRITGLFHYHDSFEDNEIIKGLEAYRPRPQDRAGRLAGFKVKLGYLGVLYRGIRKERQKASAS